MIGQKASTSNGGRIYDDYERESTSRTQSSSINKTEELIDRLDASKFANLVSKSLENSSDFRKINRKLLKSSQCNHISHDYNHNNDTQNPENYIHPLNDDDYELASVFSCSLQLDDLDSASRVDRTNASSLTADQRASSDIISLAGDLTPETRRLLLDYYIKRNIEDNNIECGCRYDHVDGNSSYRRVSSLINDTRYTKQRETLRANSREATNEGDCSNNNTCNAKLDNISPSRQRLNSLPTASEQVYPGERQVETPRSPAGKERAYEIRSSSVVVQNHDRSVCENFHEGRDALFIGIRTHRNRDRESRSEKSRSPQEPATVGVADWSNNISSPTHDGHIVVSQEHGEENLINRNNVKTSPDSKRAISDHNPDSTSHSQASQLNAPESDQHYQQTKAVSTKSCRLDESNPTPTITVQATCGESAKDQLLTSHQSHSCRLQYCEALNCIHKLTLLRCSFKNTQQSKDNNRSPAFESSLSQRSHDDLAQQPGAINGYEEEEEEIDLASELGNALVSFTESPIEIREQDSFDSLSHRQQHQQEKQQQEEKYQLSDKIRRPSCSQEYIQQAGQDFHSDCNLTDCNSSSAPSLSWSFDEPFKQHCHQQQEPNSDRTSETSLLLDELILGKSTRRPNTGSEEEPALNEFIANCIAKHQRETALTPQSSNKIFDEPQEQQQQSNERFHLADKKATSSEQDSADPSRAEDNFDETYSAGTKEEINGTLRNFKESSERPFVKLSPTSFTVKKVETETVYELAEVGQSCGIKLTAPTKEETAKSLDINNVEATQILENSSVAVEKAAKKGSDFSIAQGRDKILIASTKGGSITVESLDGSGPSSSPAKFPLLSSFIGDESSQPNDCNNNRFNSARDCCDTSLLTSAHNLGRAPKSESPSSADSERIVANRYGETASSSGCSFRSMRAVRNIAKVSVPSLASLQYLPSQLDARNQFRVVDLRASQRKSGVLKLSQQSETTHQQRQSRLPKRQYHSIIDVDYTAMKSTKKSKLMSPGADKQTPSGDNKGNLNEKSQSREDNRLDESCLFHKFCLCNCMASHDNHHNNAKENSSENLSLTRQRMSPTMQTSQERLDTQTGEQLHDNKESAPTSSEAASAPTKSSKKSSSKRKKAAKREQASQEKITKEYTSNKPQVRQQGICKLTGESNEGVKSKQGLSKRAGAQGLTSEQKVRDKDEDVSSRMVQTVGEQQCEKQSPTFMSLLGKSSKSSSMVASKGDASGGVKPSARGQQNLLKLSPGKSVEMNHLTSLRDDFCGKIVGTRRWLDPQISRGTAQGTLGSVEDLGGAAVTTGSSSSSIAVRNAADFCSNGQSRSPSSLASSSLSFLRARSTSFTSNNISTGASKNLSKNFSESNTNQPPIRAHSSCSNHEFSATERRYEAADKSHLGKRSESQNKRLSPYRKFLSPAARLFAPTVNRSDLHDPERETRLTGLNQVAETLVGDKQRQQVNKASKVAQETPKKSSFLSRSLNRLSGRVNRLKSGSKTDRTDQHSIVSSCVSPSQSISYSSLAQLDNSLISLCSLANSVELGIEAEELNNLPHKLRLNNHTKQQKCKSTLLNPGIIINKVEYMGACSCDITGAECHHNRHHNGGISSRLDHHGSHPRFADNDAMSDIGQSYLRLDSNASSQRASSLPASPRSRRRAAGGYGARSPKSPISFHSPASQSAKIEDGLKVCSIEHFEKHIGNIKGRQIEAQKQLFKAWINYVSPNLIRHDLIEELRDGIKLIGLLAALTNDKQLLSQYEKLNKDKQSYVNRLIITPSSRLKHLSNVSISINYLRQRVGMRLINLNPMDIVSGKPNVILGLCWNLILNFQLENSFCKYSQLEGTEASSCANSTISSDIYSDNSRLSPNDSNRDSPVATRVAHKSAIGIEQLEEYTPKDISKAKNRLLDHINQKFSFKLTHLTSNLVDGNILLAILRQLLPNLPEEELTTNSSGRCWKLLDDDEKLDHCFDLAFKNLHVPRLFSAADLRQQSISDNSSKPILVYLSMLVDSEPKRPQQPVPNEPPKSMEVADRPEATSISKEIKSLLQSLDVSDKFEVDKLQSTLQKIEQLRPLIAKLDKDSVGATKLMTSYEKLKSEAQQVDMLIGWINQADKLFEEPQKSPADLGAAIAMFEKFFSTPNVPQIDAGVSPTLERQRRECLATARQRLMLMEQTLTNWESYEEVRKRLRDWLVAAESKLANALRPPSHQQKQLDSTNRDPIEPIEVHSNRYDDLIEYFELESIMDTSDQDPTRSNPSLFQPRYLSSSQGSIDDVASLTGSLISLGSISSRISYLSPKKASYYKLFDDFELKCRLLAAMLDSDQKDALLLGVRELKYRLKYITEQRVPQVLSELRQNIARCEMSIEEEEQEETSEIVVENSDIKKLEVDEEPTGEIRKKPEFLDNSKAKETFQSKKHRVSSKPATYKKKGKSKKARSVSVEDAKPDSDDYCESGLLRFWRKIVRASKASFSLNIILLVCLAGVFVVPLINREACCELGRPKIETNDLGYIQRPT